VWDNGAPCREFSHVDDMTAASVHVMELGTENWQTHTHTHTAYAFASLIAVGMVCLSLLSIKFLWYFLSLY